MQSQSQCSEKADGVFSKPFILSDTPRAKHTMIETAPSDEGPSLSDVLSLVACATGAHGVLVATETPNGDTFALAASPKGPEGRRLPSSAGLRSTLDAQEVQSTSELLLPSLMAGWLGFRPGFVAARRVAWADGFGCLYFWWKDRPEAQAALGTSLDQAAAIVGSFAGRESTANAMLQMKERLDAMMHNVSLGVIFVDLLRGSLLNPMAASILNLPEGLVDTSTVVAAMQRTRAACRVETQEEVASVLSVKSSSAEYWIRKDRGLVLRVESHAVGSPQAPGRFWVFTDVGRLWESSEKVKKANRVLERNLAMLAEEMERRMEAEAALRQYSQGLKRQNEELEIAKLKSDLLANQDALTGLANRRRFRHGLEDMIAEARATGDRVVALYLDLDKFKKVNDQLGHERGDLLLRTVAETLVRAMRKTDLVARLGGDEFACAMSLPAEMKLEEIQQLVSSVSQRLNIPVESPEETIHVSATIGMAVYPDDADDAVALLRASDNAMYLGKRQGGNEVIVFSRRIDRTPVVIES